MSENIVCGIRVVLDLSSFFEDKRKKSYFYIDFSKDKIVRDVQYGISSTFSINNDLVLAVNDCYLPENVDARVLCKEDVIKVFGERIEAERYLKPSDQNGHDTIESVTTKKKRRLKNVDMKESNIETLHVSKKKRKPRISDSEENRNSKIDLEECGNNVKERESDSQLCDGVQNVECNSHTKKKIDCNVQNGDIAMHEALFNLKKFEDIEPIISATGLQRTENNETCGTKFSHVETRVLDPDLIVTKTVNEADCSANNFCSNSYDIKENTVQNEERESPTDQAGSCKKRRRRRHRKALKDPDLTSDHTCSAQSINVSSVLVNGSQKGPKHIKFVDDSGSDDCEYENSKGNNEAKGIISTQIASTSVGNVKCWKSTDSVQTKRGPSWASTSSFSTNNSELVCGNVTPNGNSTPLIFECKKASRSSNNCSMKNENDINFLKYPVLQECPKINDIIAFKKWKMDANYCPGMSDYISAKVHNVSQDEGTINLKILNGHTEFKEPQGKFSLITDEDEDVEHEDTVLKDVQMNVKDLFDIRLMFP